MSNVERCLGCIHARWVHTPNDFLFPIPLHCEGAKPKGKECREQRHVPAGLYHALFMNYLKYKKAGRVAKEQPRDKAGRFRKE